MTPEEGRVELKATRETGVGGSATVLFEVTLAAPGSLGPETQIDLTVRLERLGDVSGDREVTVLDAQQVARSAVDLSLPEESRVERLGIADCAPENRLPRVSLLEPDHRARITGGRELEFLGSGFDPEAGTQRGDELSWHSSLDGLLGSGPSVRRGDLSVGTHLVTLTSTDMKGAKASMTSRLTIEDPVSWTEISAGGAFTCGMTEDGRAFCWGHNSEGQVGDGTETDRKTPVEVLGGEDWSPPRVDPGGGHSCGITTEGTAFCWGRGSRGQLGTRDNDAAKAPVVVANPGIEEREGG